MLAVTVTLPVGVPVPGASGVTANLTVTGCPGTDGFGDVAVIDVAVFAAVTVWPTVPELPLKLASPL